MCQHVLHRLLRIGALQLQPWIKQSCANQLQQTNNFSSSKNTRGTSDFVSCSCSLGRYAGYCAVMHHGSWSCRARSVATIQYHRHQPHMVCTQTKGCCTALYPQRRVVELKPALHQLLSPAGTAAHMVSMHAAGHVQAAVGRFVQSFFLTWYLACWS